MNRRRKLVFGGLLIILVVAAAVISLLLHRLNQPVKGVVTVTNSPNKSAYSIDLTPKKVTGQYLSFDYPAGLTPQKSDPVAAPNLETFVFSARDVTSWLLGVNVSMPRGGTLSSDSGFAYRAKTPETYQASQLTVNNQPVDVMTDKTVNFGKVAYIIHGPMLVTVSLYGDDTTGTQPLETSFMMVLNSLQWQ